MKTVKEKKLSSSYRLLQLSKTDVNILRQMIHLFGEAFEEPETYLSQKTSSAYLEGLLQKSHIIFIAALYKDKVVGGLAAYVLEKFEQERSEVYIYDLAVHLEHRRKGIATALIDKLRELISNSNAWVIFVQADKTDEPAILLYESLGHREDVLHFDIPVKKHTADSE